MCTGYTEADNLGRIVSIAFDRVNWSAALDEGDGSAALNRVDEAMIPSPYLPYLPYPPYLSPPKKKLYYLINNNLEMIIVY